MAKQGGGRNSKKTDVQRTIVVIFMFIFLLEQVLFLVKKVKVTAAFSCIFQNTLSLSAAPPQKLPEGPPTKSFYMKHSCEQIERKNKFGVSFIF